LIHVSSMNTRREASIRALIRLHQRRLRASGWPCGLFGMKAFFCS
jgi:hypothetical protein